ncbi:hypothetical protein ACHIPZ_03380 [Antrihabitans sp. NCIMB 15449]|uniref:DUF559 domain-containing protein n=1 Tax=Antrihabitans spumae TaxID=3373370 RepID=A0ABW7JJR8_9NOCA
MGTYDRPFRGSQAIALGELTAYQLRCDFTRVYRDIYVRKRIDLTAHMRAHAAAVYSGENSILAGRSAAALHGTKWIDPHEPAEVIRHDNFHAPKGLIVRQYSIHPDEIVTIHGRRVTTPARTAFDLGRTLHAPRAIEIVDALCNATQLRPHEVAELAERHPGARGIVGLRSMLGLVDGGAESPPETRTRLTIIDAGLPRPETQLVITDDSGYFVARADLGWRRWQVLVEYEGDGHWSDPRQKQRDLERYPRLEELGWRIVRVGSALLSRREELIRRISAKLRDAGAPL